ncbi:MAG: cupin domain-containing protein [Bacteroidales bacterium]|nr:cupin domain-containing protein [Bacteroidales bacterium]
MPVYKEISSVPEKIRDGFERRITHLDNLMMAVCDFTDGPMEHPESPHSHPHEQIAYIAQGDLYFHVGEEKHHLVPGDIVTIPSGVPHCIQILSEHVRLIDCFSPVREEFIVK